ncbi:nucleotidyltransferase family protein [Rhizosaccharibacter radicis]|uniref:Nucleotidyltransferase family protein n=1 Tax=Rhizosaccharibacter radicis TaxID=2782605 RepID=A0ABT1VZ45_9PROT|nr:nucleotidyltransferase family protein [Acetobacteraceae bacterium KSS12]
MTPDAIAAMLRRDRCRWPLLALVQALGLPDGWIGAGFLRNAVWDLLHDRPPSPPDGDVDVVWFDRAHASPAIDREIEARLRTGAPWAKWSVRNQARMHERNGDPPYRDTADALLHWPETATAVAARRIGADGCEIIAPYGLNDLAALILRPTPGFQGAKRPVFEARHRSKRWLARWPGLRQASP